MTQNLSRRLFLGSSLALIPVAAPIILGCNAARSEPPRDAGRVDNGRPDTAPGAQSTDGPRCTAGVGTESSIEGPYYRDGAPFRTDLVDPDVTGSPLILLGSIMSLDCKTPLSGAVVDVWQANGNGQYDNDGSQHLPEGAMRLRGKLRTDARGGFSCGTVLPGRYLNGKRFRPAHIHVKVSAAGHVPLTTQLYFPDDPYNDGDPFIHRSLILDMSRIKGAVAGRYDFTLRPLPRG